MKFYTRLLAALLALVLLMTCAACGGEEQSDEEEQQDVEITGVDTEGYSPEAETWGDFTMLYDPAHPVNPYTSKDLNNLMLSQLLYEGLFVLGPDFSPETLLAESYTTQDSIRFDFTLRDDIRFSDGSPLTAADVVYSLGLARQSTRFGKRLAVINDCESTGDSSFCIILDGPNTALPSLLDFPVIKNDSGEADIPVGTGPYTMTQYGKALLVNRRYHGDVPRGRIELRKLDTSYSEAFNTGTLDMAYSTVCGDGGQVYYGNSESRYFDTTILNYIGFNTNNTFFKYAPIRAAVSALIDRSELVNNVFLTRALPAVTPFSPAWYGYDVTWGVGLPKGDEALVTAFEELGVGDLDEDGRLEMPGTAEEERYMLEFVVDFVVNKENPYKVKAAERIAEMLQQQGIIVKVRALSWNDYLTALKNRNFDMYYGEAFLPADFDLTSMLRLGGSLNYGDFSGEGYETLLSNLKSAGSEDELRAAGTALVDALRRDAPIAPLLFRKNAAVLTRNRVSGVTPTQSSVFYHLSEWEIK